MTNEAIKTHQAIAVLKLPTTVSGLAPTALQIVASMTGNPNFAAPAPALATITAAIGDLQSAEADALARTHGAAAARNAKRQALVRLLEQARTYVQAIADASVSDSQGIILSAGMSVRKAPVQPPRVFAAVPGEVSGAVKLIAAAAARRASYDWRCSLDGGTSWVVVPSTLEAKTTVSGLTAGTNVSFRYRALTHAGQGDWSQTVSTIVR